METMGSHMYVFLIQFRVFVAPAVAWEVAAPVLLSVDRFESPIQLFSPSPVRKTN